MKRIFALIPLIGLILLMTSCVSTKKIVYFQGSDSIFSQAQDIMQQYEMKLKPADQILIKLTCSEPELLNIFAQDVVMGTAGSSISTNITNQGNMTNAYAYTVTNDGYIILPAVGKVKVEGMTTDETAKRIEESIQEKNLIKDPGVTVRLLNGRVAVIGAVKTPQVVNLTSERNTILDVLAKVGGLDIAGMAGVFLGGALYHVPVVIDGFISEAAALCAVRMVPEAAEYLIPSHASKEPAGQMLLDALGLSPFLTCDMCLRKC